MPDLKTKTTISIVVPFHNEEANVTELYGQLHAVMEASTAITSSYLSMMEARTSRTSC
jgi:hypothetical protein